MKGRWKGAPVALKVIRGGGIASKVGAEAMVGLAAVHPNIVSLATGSCSTHQ